VCVCVGGGGAVGNRLIHKHQEEHGGDGALHYSLTISLGTEIVSRKAQFSVRV